MCCSRSRPPSPLSKIDMDHQVTRIIDIERAAEFAAERGHGPDANPHPNGTTAFDLWDAAYRAHKTLLESVPA